ncbi:hypothetical protein FPRO04_13258 [Fusarium proliferatum]|nr:hypothetical protein FPRO04_13258 [Fusarium proliferatum]
MEGQRELRETWELEERRKSLTKRAQIPPIPHPNEFSPTLAITIETAEPKPLPDDIPPRNATEPPQRSMYTSNVPIVGLPATPKAMRLIIEGNHDQSGSTPRPNVPSIPAVFTQLYSPETSPRQSLEKEEPAAEPSLTLLPSTVYQPPTKAPPYGIGRRRILSPPMLTALLDRVSVKTKMYRDEMVEFREKEFKTTIPASNISRSLRHHGRYRPHKRLASADDLIPALLPRLPSTPHVLPTRMESPVRILIIVKKRALAWQQAWEEPQKLITQVLKHLQYDSLVSLDDLYDSSTCRFLAIERWDSHTLIVCDLFNTSYDPLNAHQEGNNELPVKVVRICQGNQSDIIKAKEPQAIGQVDEQLRSIHDMHGWNEGPPYKIDHADGKYPIYIQPRSMVYT